MGALGQVIRSEWTKIRSVRSTVWTLGIAVVVTIGLGVLICTLATNDFSSMPQLGTGWRSTPPTSASPGWAWASWR